MSAIETIREACRLAESVEIQGVEKGDRSPVTVADFAVQALVTANLGPIVGEESRRELEASGLESQVAEALKPFGIDDVSLPRAEPASAFWTLDPIDGTKGFLRGGQYAIALARIENGEVTSGMLGCPRLDLGLGGRGVVLKAERGGGCWASPLDHDNWSRLHVSACSQPVRARLLHSFEAAHTDPEGLDKLRETLGLEADGIGIDSQAKYALLAAGKGELIVRLLSPKQPDYREKIWDQAAGSLILEEAGGRVTDLWGRPLDFAVGTRLERNRGVLASNGALHGQALKALEALN